MERHFNEYELARMSQPPGAYQLNWVRELFENYIALVEQDYPKWTTIINFPNKESVPVRGVAIDISIQTINRILFGLAVPNLEYRLRNAFA